jgi:tRNA (mo5U34)-methyltransferase
MDNTLQSHLNNPRNELERQIARLGPWFHNLHLPSGTQTAPGHPLGDFPAFKWRQIEPHLPADLAGWSALDIGCNAGFYAFELTRRGAAVTALDLDARYLRQAEWAAAQLGLAGRVEFLQMQVYDLARVEALYDLVWFMGVFYHLRYPLLGLDIACRKVRRLMVFQTLMMPGEEEEAATEKLTLEDCARMHAPGWPKMGFVEHRLEDDPTNWWVPNHAGVLAMLRSCGMRVIARPAREIYICEPAPDCGKTLREREDELFAATGRF